jgi:hypothetical protein
MDANSDFANARSFAGLVIEHEAMAVPTARHQRSVKLDAALDLSDDRNAAMTAERIAHACRHLDPICAAMPLDFSSKRMRTRLPHGFRRKAVRIDGVVSMPIIALTPSRKSEEGVTATYPMRETLLAPPNPLRRAVARRCQQS